MPKKLTNEEFIERAKLIHGDKYDYSKVSYVNSETKVTIICPKHGEFKQSPHCHLKGQRCFYCAHEEIAKKNTSTTEEFIEKSEKVHGNKYDYSKVNYVRKDKKVVIICSEHGEFKQTPNDHLNGYGCPICGSITSSNKRRIGNNAFIERAKLIHGDKYDYSKVNYFDMHKKVCIICPKHGEFWQTPTNHLNGAGCPRCKMTKLEKSIMSSLNKAEIKYIYQYRNKEMFGKQIIDFYLPDHRIAIECQGIQHFQPTDFSGKGKEWAKMAFESLKISDKIKKKKCEENGINLIYFLTESRFFGTYDNEFHNTDDIIYAISN